MSSRNDFLELAAVSPSLSPLVRSSNSRTSGDASAERGRGFVGGLPVGYASQVGIVSPPSQGLRTSYSAVLSFAPTASAVRAALFSVSSAGGSGLSPPSENDFLHFSRLVSIPMDAS